MSAKRLHCVNVEQDQEEEKLGTLNIPATTTVKGAKTGGAESSASTVSTSASSPTLSDLDQMKNELDQAEKEVRFWSNKVKENFENWEKETNSEQATKKKESLKEAKEGLNGAKVERDRLSAKVQRVKAEIVAVTRKPLFWNDVPPSVEDLLQMNFPEFKLRDIGESRGLPIGPDRQVDMRFFPGARPAAEKTLGKVRALHDDAQMMLVAVSGAGKTSAIFQVARDIFTLYIPCTPGAAQNTRPSRDKTESFAAFEAAINRSVPLKLTADEKTEEAMRLSLIFLVVHYFLLVLFLKRFPSATPFQFLLFQLAKEEGNDIVEQVFSRLEQLSVDSAKELARAIRRYMIQLPAVSRSPVLLAVDEIECATLLSPFLRATGAFGSTTPVPMLLCGTGYGQDRYDSARGGIGKAEVPQFLARDFPLPTKDDVVRILGTLPGVTKEMIDDLANLGYLVNARYGLVARSVEIFMERTKELSPIVRLNYSVDSSVKQHKQKLMDSIQEQVDSVSPEKKSRLLKLLHAIYVGSKLSNGRMEFTTWDLDLGRIGLGAVIEKNVFRVSELFALDAIEALFESSRDLNESRLFEQSVKDLQTVIRACGETLTARKELLEKVVFQAFRRACFQGKPVSELGFVSKLERTEEEERKQKEWGNVIFNCNAVQTLPMNASDSQFVHDHPYVMLSPQDDHRADGILYLSGDHLMELGIKFHSSRVPPEKVESQFRATDPNKAYGHAWMNNPVAANAERRAKWDEFGFNKMKALRVHVNIPCAVRRYFQLRTECVYFSGTYLMEDGSLVVNIEMSNLDLLFGNPENDEEKKTMDAIYRLLAVVHSR